MPSQTLGPVRWREQGDAPPWLCSNFFGGSLAGIQEPLSQEGNPRTCGPANRWVQSEEQSTGLRQVQPMSFRRNQPIASPRRIGGSGRHGKLLMLCGLWPVEPRHLSMVWRRVDQVDSNPGSTAKSQHLCCCIGQIDDPARDHWTSVIDAHDH